MTEKAKPPVAYEDRLCLFIDILGFKNHVEESVKPADKDAKTGHRPFTVARLHRALTQSIKLKHSWLRQKFNEIARPLEQSRYRQLNGGSVPENLEDHIRSLAPFK